MECKHCNKNFSKNQTFVIHMSTSHRFASSFSCCYKKCTRNFSSLSSLKKHIHSLHNNDNVCMLNVAAKNKKIFHSTQETQLVSRNINEQTIENELTSDVPQDCSNANLKEKFEVSILKYASTLYSNDRINRSVVQEMLNHTSELITSLFSCLLNKLTSPDKADYNDIVSVLSTDLFSSINSEYKRFQLLTNLNLLIMPKPYLIGRMFDSKSCSSATSSSLNIKQCEGQIISLRILLKNFLEIPNVLNEMLIYIQSEEANVDYISSIFNSNLWKSLKNKYKNKTILPLFLYYDDFETGNPLGTQAGVHKLGGMYFSFAGLEQKYASRLENIFLWGLFYSSDRIFFSNTDVFRPFLDELKFLESEGVLINNQRIHFVVPLLLGDNLGINSIIGMTESFSSNHFCRLCFSHKSLTQSMTTEDFGTFRNRNNYNIHLEENSHGIKSECIWNDLPYFHNTENIHFDCMHDLYEGVCRYDFGKILKNLIFEKKYFTINLLNNRTKFFNHSEVDVGNRIPPIPISQIEKELIIMSAAEMHAFVTYFSFIVGDLVDPSDRTWHFYLLLFNIVHIASKNSTKKSELIYFQNLVRTHHELYISLFNGKLTPKFHFLTHYSKVIQNVGPLSKLSSIRYEAFHRISKCNSNIVSSRKNLPYTLALKHQLKLAYRLLLSRGFSDKIEIGSRVSSLCSEDIILFSQCLPDIKDYFTVNYIKRNGIVYKKGIVFQINRDLYGEPMFGIIEKVLHNEMQQFYLIYKKIVCYGIDKHFEAYHVKDILFKTYIISLNDIFWPFLTHIHTCGNGNKYISCMNQEM